MSIIHAVRWSAVVRDLLAAADPELKGLPTAHMLLLAYDIAMAAGEEEPAGFSYAISGRGAAVAAGGPPRLCQVAAISEQSVRRAMRLLLASGVLRQVGASARGCPARYTLVEVTELDREGLLASAAQEGLNLAGRTRDVGPALAGIRRSRGH